MALRRLALFSCSNKSGIKPLARYFLNRDYDIISTGGTYSVLKDYIQNEEQQYTDRLYDVQSHTEFPEILSGRVKTLHPKIHAGILGIRDNPNHIVELKNLKIPFIDVVVSNLYPFEEVSRQYMQDEKSFDEVIENIDIGGITLTRAAAKNYKDVTIITDPKQYSDVMKRFDEFTTQDRFDLAIEAFRKTSVYDEEIFEWMYPIQQKMSRNSHASSNSSSSRTSKRIPNELHPQYLQKRSYSTASNSNIYDVYRKYKPQYGLKYGSNPHQCLSKRHTDPDTGANVYSICNRSNRSFPFSVLNGNASYINMLDAINSWQLVKELSDKFETYAAASYKHTSPAGAAIFTNKDFGRKQFNCDKDPGLIAYKKARGADPMCSFGDFIAVSGTVNIHMANYIRKQVSDGIIAERYTPEALEILSKKKKGKYVVLQGNVNNDIPNIEFREMYGVAISQPVNTETIEWKDLSKDNVVTIRKTLTDQERDDLMLANISLKYAQSNNVALAVNGQLVGISAGQQSRIHSVRLASHKAKVWMLRHEPIIDILLEKHLSSNIKSLDKTNVTIRLIEHCLGETLTTPESNMFRKQYNIDAVLLEKLEEFVENYKFEDKYNISLASDAFFPFRDNIDCASNIGVTAIAQPGGSVRDEPVIEACDDYGIAMVCHNKRMFTH